MDTPTSARMPPVPRLSAGERSGNIDTPEIYFHYDPDCNRLFSSNVRHFPQCGIPRRARQLVNDRFHLPQFERGDDPVRPFFILGRPFEESDLLKSLHFVPLHEIQVFEFSGNQHLNPGWTSAFTSRWTLLEHFLYACCRALGYTFPDLPEHQEHYRIRELESAPSAEDARRRVFVWRKYLNHMVAALSYSIFVWSKEQAGPQDDHSIPRWMTYLLQHPHVAPLKVLGPDEQERLAGYAVEELNLTIVPKFRITHATRRVGLFADPRALSASRHTSMCLRANVPVWFDWGPADATRMAASSAYGGRPPVAFIPPPGAHKSALTVNAFPYRNKHRS
jgi:hypothetical protein